MLVLAHNNSIRQGWRGGKWGALNTPFFFPGSSCGATLKSRDVLGCCYQFMSEVGRNGGGMVAGSTCPSLFAASTSRL